MSSDEEEFQARGLTTEEKRFISVYLDEPYYDLQDNLFCANWGEKEVTSTTGRNLWTFTDTVKEISEDDLEQAFPGIKLLDNVNYTELKGFYQNKRVRWSRSNKRWQYNNNAPVQFPDVESEEENVQEPPDDDTEQAEVSQLLESTTQTVTALLSRVSTPQTPGTPQTVPGALPSTPGPSSQSIYPTPLTPAPFRNPVLPPRPPQSTVQVQPVVVPPVTPTVTVPAVPARHMATPKLLGTLPEPFDGTPSKAEAFWNVLANYYFLNEDVYTNESKRVSAALTHFKIGTPAGDWAQDRQKTVLAQAVPSFGTWATFKADFAKHFIPSYSALEATNDMYTNRMGNRPFNEWYQEWSTSAKRSGANEETMMYAFRKAIPAALHQKLMTVTPPPDTLNGLVEKAGEFDRVWRLFSNPAFTGRGGTRRTFNRAMTTDDTGAQVNATTSQRPQLNMGKISKEEKDRRFKEKLCFYCGKPNHTAKECRIKKSQYQSSQSSRPSKPRQDFRARAAVAQEELYEETPEEHPAQIAAISQSQFTDSRPHSVPVNEDF